MKKNLQKVLDIYSTYTAMKIHRVKIKKIYKIIIVSSIEGNVLKTGELLWPNGFLIIRIYL